MAHHSTVPEAIRNSRLKPSPQEMSVLGPRIDSVVKWCQLWLLRMAQKPLSAPPICSTTDAFTVKVPLVYRMVPLHQDYSKGQTTSYLHLEVAIFNES
jgi:hypothetical protein